MKRKREPEPLCGCTRLVSVGDSPAFTAALVEIRATLRREFEERDAEEYRLSSIRAFQEWRDARLLQIRSEEESAYQL